MEQQGMDTGLHSLVAIARFHQLPAEPGQLAHQFAEPGKLFSDTQLLSAAKALTLRAKLVSPGLSQIKNGTLPAIAKTHDCAYIILARIGENAGEDGSETARTFQIHDLRDPAPHSVTQAVQRGTASFFLQLLALVTPLFIQVVIDKVLVHRGFTTLFSLPFSLEEIKKRLRKWGAKQGYIKCGLLGLRFYWD